MYHKISKKCVPKTLYHPVFDFEDWNGNNGTDDLCICLAADQWYVSRHLLPSAPSVSQRQYAQKIHNRAIIIRLRFITGEMVLLNKRPSVKEQKPLFSPLPRIMTAFF